MNNKYKFRFSKSRTSLEKYKPPPDPLEREQKSSKMEPRQDWYNQKIVQYIKEFDINQKKGGIRVPERPLPSNPPVSPYYYQGNVNDLINMYYSSSPSGTPHVSPVSSDERDPTVEEIQDFVEQNKAYQDMLAKMKFKTWGENLSDRARKEYVIDFIKWMMGTSELNLDLKKTPWGRNRLVGPGISEFIEGYIDKKTSYELAVQKMRAMIPMNIEEAWLYYKFIASKPDLVGPQTPLTHNGKIDPDAYDWDFFPEFDWWLKKQQGWTAALTNIGIRPDELPPEFEYDRHNATLNFESMNRFGNSSRLPSGVVENPLDRMRGPLNQNYSNRGDPGPLSIRMEGRSHIPPPPDSNRPSSPPPPPPVLYPGLNERGSFLEEEPANDYSIPSSPQLPASPSYAPSWGNTL